MILVPFFRSGIFWAIITGMFYFSADKAFAQCNGILSYSPGPVLEFCPGIQITIQNTSTGNGFSIAWRLNGKIAGTGNSFSGKFSSGDNLFLVRIFNGCRDSVKVQFKVKPRPKASLTSPNFFRNCTSDTSITSNPFLLSINNTSNLNGVTPTNYQVDWGDGSPPDSFGPTFAGSSHTYDGQLGLRYLRFIISSNNGCSDTLVQPVFNGRPPRIALPSGGSNVELCVSGTNGASFPLNLINYQTNPPGTIYIIESTDPKTKPDTFSHPPPNPIIYRFLSSSCGFTSALTPNALSVTITAKNFCPLPQSSTRAPIIVKQKPIVTTTIEPENVQCINTPVTFKSFNTGQDIILNPATGLPDCTKDLIFQQWSITPSTYTITSGSMNSGSFTAVFNVPGNYQVRFLGKNTCETDSFVKNFCVRKPPDASFTHVIDQECSPMVVTTTNTSASLLGAACQPSSFSWKVTQKSFVCSQKDPFHSFKNGGGSSVSPSIELNSPGQYTITLTETNGCGIDKEERDFTVKGKPELGIGPLSGGCGGAVIQPFLSNNKNCLGKNSSVYWYFPGASPDSAIGEIPGKITYQDSGSYKIYVRDTNECGPASDSSFIEVVAMIKSDAGKDDTICSGEMIEIGTKGRTGIFYKWKPSQFILNPTSAIAQFRPQNILTSKVFSLIRTDSLSEKCVEHDTVEILVHPIPKPPKIINDTVCKGFDGFMIAIPDNSTQLISWYDTPSASNLLGKGDTLKKTANLIAVTAYVNITDTNNCSLPAPLPAKILLFNENPIQPKTDEICTDKLAYNLNALTSPVKSKWTGTGVFDDSLIIPQTAGLVLLNYSYSDANNCKIAGQTQLTVKAPVIPDVGLPKNVCLSEKNIKLSGIPDGGTWAYQGNILSSGIFTWTQSGSYNLIYEYGKRNCARFDTLILKVNPLPVVSAGPDIKACINKTPFSINATPPGGLWDRKEIINDSLFPGNLLPGDYTAKYTFTDSNGCVDSSKMKITIWPLPETAIKILDTACLREPAGFFNQSPGLATYTWLYGDGDSSNTAEGYHTHTFKTPGYFNIKLIGKNAVGCLDTSMENVFVSPPPIPFVSPSDSSGCGPLKIKFRNLSNTPGAKFRWVFGNGQTFDGFEPPQDIVYGGFPTQNVNYEGRLVLSTNYCKDRFAGFNIQVIASPVAKIGLDGNPVGCSPFKTKIFNNSLGGPQFKQFSINDTLVSPHSDTLDRVFYANDTTKNFMIRLEVSNPGCPASKDSLQIKVVPNKVKASFIWSGKTGNCAPQIIEFKNTSLPADVYQWDFGNGTGTFTGKDTNWLYKNGGNYPVKLYAYRNCPNTNKTISDTSVQIIQINPKPKISATPVIKPCNRNKVKFENNTGLPGYSFIWTFGDGLGSAEPSPEHAYPDSGLYKVRMIGFAPVSGCSDTLFFNVRLYPSPVSKIDTSRKFLCAGDSLSLVNQSINADKSLWVWGDGSSILQNTKTITHTYNQPGIYDLSLITYNAKSICYDTLTVKNMVEARALPKGGFQIEPRIAAYKSCLINIIPATTINSFTSCRYVLFNEKGDSLKGINDCDGEITCNELEPGTYKVQQIIIGDFNCNYRQEAFFQVREFSTLYLPNAFIPESGVNEETRIFKAYGTGIVKFNMLIFDRWGKIIFESDNLQEGWNGNFKKSEAPVPPGVYTVKIKYTNIENNEIVQFGTVALIR